MQIRGFAYQVGRHDILARRRTAIGPGGALEAVDNLPNERLVNNQYAKLVTQKANYLLGKPFAMEGENGAYIARLRAVFDRRFLRLLKNTGKAMLCGGIAWLYPYADEAGRPAFRLLPAYEVLPLWRDRAHTVLDKAVRVYLVERGGGGWLEKAEVYSPEGVQCLELVGGKLVPDPDAPAGVQPYGRAGDGPLAWGRVPLVAFRANESETPLLRRVKTLQDALNVMLSEFANRMLEDTRNTVLVLKNYDGTNLGEFRRNLAQYGAVKVRSEGEADGGVETLRIEFSAENYRQIITLLREAIVENGMGYDARDLRLSGHPNQMNIRSMYSDIDLDANEMETELQASMQELLTFVRPLLGEKDGGDVTFLFNRDMLMSESEAIANCAASADMLSRETIVAQHPWVEDPQRELRRIQKEEWRETDGEGRAGAGAGGAAGGA